MTAVPIVAASLLLNDAVLNPYSGKAGEVNSARSSFSLSFLITKFGYTTEKDREQPSQLRTTNSSSSCTEQICS